MQKTKFHSSPSGQLVTTERGAWAFVPNALPPLNLDMARLAEPLAGASAGIGELNGLARFMPNPTLMIRPVQMREALSSSSMEGTYSTADELLFLNAGGKLEEERDDAREVSNYLKGLEEAIESLEKLPLSIRTLNKAHETLLTGVSRTRGRQVRPGELKQFQNFIGGSTLENARFVPPPPNEARECLYQLEAYLNRENGSQAAALIDSALIHYQMETIHPYADGNGRVGRILIILHLIATGVVSSPILYLSPTLEQRKDEYIDLMYNVSRQGEWEQWITFYLSIIEESCTATIAKADLIINLNREFRQRAAEAGRSSKLLTLVDQLFVAPVLSIPQASEALGVTYVSAQNLVQQLVKGGVLREVEGTANPQLFIAREIVQLIYS